MTAANVRQNIHPSDAANLLEIYDKNSRIDLVQTAAAEREVFSDANTVRRADGTIDHAATVAQHAVAKVKAVNNRK
jgi:hypothetical protein